MKKGAFLCVLILACVPGIFAKTGDKMYVNVQESAVRSGTGMFAAEVGSVSYGEQVTVVSEKGKWVEIVSGTQPQVRGWIPVSSLTKKKIVVRDGKNSVSASADELALAGKGFSADVEGAFRGGNNALRYDLVDVVENRQIDPELLYAFIVEGNLAGGAE